MRLVLGILQAMESCPKKDIPNFKELLKEENFYLTTEVIYSNSLSLLWPFCDYSGLILFLDNLFKWAEGMGHKYKN